MKWAKPKLAPRRVLAATPGTVLRPVVGLDIDGTLAFWHEHFLWFASEYTGKRMPEKYLGALPLYREMGISKETYRQIKLAYRQSGLKRAMCAVPGAADLVAAVRAAGAEVWVCTTRPYLRLDNIDPDTRAWLRRNRITYDGVLFGERKYHDLATLVGSGRVISIIDDLPEQVGNARDAGLRARLIQRVYNEPSWERCEGLADLRFAAVWLTTEIERWKGQNGV
jgi:hypothetical protein